MKCYEILDIRPGATVETVRKAYVELAHVWDPAQHLNNPPLRQVAEEKRKEIDAAYNALQAFLPDLSRKKPAESHPVRPTDAMTDAPAPSASTETSTTMYLFFVLLILAAVAAASVFIWRSAHRLPAVFSLENL